MATMRCRCGQILRDEDDAETTMLLFSQRDYDIDISSSDLLGRAVDLWRCPNCGRLWVFWDESKASEYVPGP